VSSSLLLLPLAIWIIIFYQHASFSEAQKAFSEIFPFLSTSTNAGSISGNQFTLILITGLAILIVSGLIQFNKSKAHPFFKLSFLLINIAGVLAYLLMAI
jgi:hypothetical protein